MAYTPKTWERNDTITADALNHIEQGIANSGGGTALIIGVERTEELEDRTIFYYDKTYQEVKDAYDAGLPIYLERYDDGDGFFAKLPLFGVSDPTLGRYGAKVYDFDTSGPMIMISASADGQLFYSARK